MSPQWLNCVKGYSPYSGTTDSCKKDCAPRIIAEIVNSLVSLWRRHLSVQALKTDVIDIQCLSDEVEHLGPVREDNAKMRSATTSGERVKVATS